MKRRSLLLLPFSLSFAQAAHADPARIAIGNPWAKPSVTEAAAMFASFLNTGGRADRLMAGATPIAERVIFRDRDGSPLEYYDLLPRRPVVLRPGGRYIALRGLKAPLAVDDSFPMTFYFAAAGAIAVTVVVVEGQEEE
jgi:periplasmic copper chaperone A